MVGLQVLLAVGIHQQNRPAVVVRPGIPQEEETAFHSAASYHLEIHPAVETAYLAAFLGILRVVGKAMACRLVPLACRMGVRLDRLDRLVVGSHLGPLVEETHDRRLGSSAALGLSQLGLRRRRKM